MDDKPDYSAKVTTANDGLADLVPSWRTAVFSADDGIAPMASLHEAGDALVAVARFDDHNGMTVLGSGVMVAPGILLTATHVLEEFRRQRCGPIFTTFLPDAIRLWLPIDAVTISGQSAFHEDRKVTSDLSLVSCTLNSEAYPDRPLMLAPMQIALPLVGERLWAMGFRHQKASTEGAFVTPYVSSGLVTAAFPNGRGERMASPCFEVGMETLGGMSGGAVVNSDGLLVGIVSSSLDGGPSYVTLIWEALRLDVKAPIPKLATHEKVSLFGARGRNLAKIKGDVRRDPFGEVQFRLSDAEAVLFKSSLPPEAPEQGRGRALSGDELEAFEEEWRGELEEIAAGVAVDALARLSLPMTRRFLEVSGVLEECLTAIVAFGIEDLEGVEDFEITSTEQAEGDGFRVELLFDLRRVCWTIEVPLDRYIANKSGFDDHFHNVNRDASIASMDILQRCYFRANVMFDRANGTFSDACVTTFAVKRPRRARTTA